MNLSTEQIKFQIVERFAEMRIEHKLANYTIEATRREAYNDVAIRLRARMVDDVIWYNEFKNDPIVAPGIWNNIKEALPAKLAIWLGGVMLVDTSTEHHLHHTCPHIEIPVNGKAHFDWMRAGS